VSAVARTIVMLGALDLRDKLSSGAGVDIITREAAKTAPWWRWSRWLAFGIVCDTIARRLHGVA